MVAMLTLSVPADDERAVAILERARQDLCSDGAAEERWVQTIFDGAPTAAAVLVAAAKRERFTRAQLARDLQISPGTLDSHWRNLGRSARVANRHTGCSIRPPMWWNFAAEAYEMPPLIRAAVLRRAG